MTGRAIRVFLLPLALGVLPRCAPKATEQPGSDLGGTTTGGSPSTQEGGGARNEETAGAATAAGRVGAMTGGAAGSPAGHSSAMKGGASGSTAGSAGSKAGGASDSTAGSAGAASPCGNPALVWKTANKTHYESYPDPGSEECIEFNGCTWEGQFAACDEKKSEAWVAEHNIAAAFPDFGTLRLHDLCLRKGQKTLVVTVLDTCGDSDCDGCCTENRGTADQLIDLESYTNARWGVPDGPIEWADLGPTRGTGCD